jgi:hypothetical protein
MAQEGYELGNNNKEDDNLVGPLCVNKGGPICKLAQSRNIA